MQLPRVPSLFSAPLRLAAEAAEPKETENREILHAAAAAADDDDDVLAVE